MARRVRTLRLDVAATRYGQRLRAYWIRSRRQPTRVVFQRGNWLKDLQLPTIKTNTLKCYTGPRSWAGLLEQHNQMDMRFKPRIWRVLSHRHWRQLQESEVQDTFSESAGGQIRQGWPWTCKVLCILQTGYLEHKEVISAIKKLEFVNHRMSYRGIRGRWCDAVLNAHTQTENTSDSLTN